MIPLAPVLLLAAMLVPIGAGLAATVLPAFGWLPALGGHAPSLQPWRDLLASPGLGRAVALTIGTGLAATTASFAVALALAVAARRPAMARVVTALLAPLLATPHAAMAIGLGFLIAPSGWLARLLSPWLTGWSTPPDLATVQDPWGIALTVGLCLKEIPYLLLAILAALAQADAMAARRVAAALGYGPWRAWALVVLPRIWPQMRLPVMAVLAFSLSVVDVALILGPSAPPTLAVMVLRLFADADLARWFPACAGALLLAGIVAAGLGLLLLIERVAARIGTAASRTGRRGGTGSAADAASMCAAILLALLGAGALAVLALWSFAGAWRFPDVLPARWSAAAWQAPMLRGPLLATIGIGLAATILALLLAALCLEREQRTGTRPGRSLALLYLPLLVPQIAFLSGFQQMLVRANLDGGALALVWSHLVFVLPYVFLSLADPWRALDPRLARAAAGLGASPARVLLRITLPLMLRPLLAAGAVGFAVSAGLYLPTLFAGAGRVATLATEAVTLSSGGDRRIGAASALLQAMLPLLAYAAAILLPAWTARHRRGMALQ